MRRKDYSYWVEDFVAIQAASNNEDEFWIFKVVGTNVNADMLLMTWPCIGTTYLEVETRFMPSTIPVTRYG